MKLKAFLFLFALCAGALAAEESKTAQPKTPQSELQQPESGQNAGQPEEEPTEEILPGEPGVNITKTTRADQTIEEFRVGGHLYMIKITPKHGRPYYLVDDRGDGRFARQEGLDSGVRVPQWVIKKF